MDYTTARLSLMECLLFVSVRRMLRNSPNPLTYSSSPSPIQRPRMDPDPCPPPDRFNQLLRKLQHVEHMLGDVSSSDGSPVKSRR